MKEIALSTAKFIFNRWIDTQENHDWIYEYPEKRDEIINEIAKEIRAAIVLCKEATND